MSYKVSISPTAYNQIAEIISFVKNESVEAAKQLYKEIINKIESLSDMPERCPQLDELKMFFGATRKLLVGKGRYAILFRIQRNNVYVNYVFDLRQNKFWRDYFK